MISNNLTHEEDPYENPFVLNVNLSLSSTPSSYLLIDQIAKKLNLTTKKNKIHLSMVLANLRQHAAHKRHWTSYSRDKYKFSNLPIRYNPLSITVFILTKIIDTLWDQSFIEHKEHVFIKKGHPSNRTSRMRATPKLIELFGKYQPSIEHAPNQELLILKDKNKAIIGYDDSKRTVTMRNTIKKYNQLLEHMDISLNLAKVDIGDLDFDFTQKRVVRIFNNSSFSQGGRFYRAFWIQCPSNLRKHILINGKPTVELDYQALHVRLLYAEEKATYPKNKDPYHLPKYMDLDRDLNKIRELDLNLWKEKIIELKKIRYFLKKTLLMSFNTKSLQSLKGAINEDIKEKPTKYPPQKDQPNVKEVMNIFKKVHQPIAKYIYKSMGPRIQYLDSQIAEYVIKKMTKKGLPILTVHDSFICIEEDEEALTNYMKEAFIHLFKKDFTLVTSPAVTRVGAFKGFVTSLHGMAFTLDSSD